MKETDNGTSGAELLLSVRGLRKRYGDFLLRDIELALPAGYICGYVGPNGAGKTTTLHAVCRLLKPDAGEIRVDGLAAADDPVAYKEKLGYIGDSSYLPGDLTRRDLRGILKDFYASFDGARFDALADRWELPGKTKLSGYSRGMAVKLMFAAVLARNSKLLILDEATNGLDPMVRRDILALLQEYVEDGAHSVLFSTHIMEDLTDIADFVCFIDGGERVFFETKDELTERYLEVKGGAGELTEALTGQLIGVQQNEYSFAALYDTESGANLPAGLAADRPTIDQIIVHMIEERRKNDKKLSGKEI